MPATVAVIMLHSLCNMECSFCVNEDSMGSFNFEQARTLLDRLRSEGFVSVVIGGGEPLAWGPGMWRLTEEAKLRGFFVQVGTNGILLPDGFEKTNSVDRWVIPLDGSSAAIHNAVRFYRERHFEIIVDRLDRLRSAGKSTTVSTVVTRVNRHDLLNIGSRLHELNAPRPFIHAWHLYQFVPEGRGGAEHKDELLLDRADYDLACAPIKEAGLGFTVFKRPDMLRSKSVEFFSMRDGLLHRQLGDSERIEPL